MPGNHGTGKKRPARKGFVRVIITLLFQAVGLAALLGLVLGVRPETEKTARASLSLDLMSRVEIFEKNAASDLLGDLIYIPKHYVIPEDAAAPAPAEACYGSTTDPGELQAVIDQAAELLDGQPVVFDPEVVFQPGIPIRYYRDDTILVIAWREIIDRKLCTFAEVRIADGSQLRRKLAGDAYGSSTEMYATDLASEANAVVAINGDFYIHRSAGVNVWQRQVTRFKLADRLDSCFFTAGGDMLMTAAGTFGTQEAVQAFVDENDVTFGVTFGPILVEDGQPLTIPDGYPLGEVEAYYSRSVVAVVDDLHYLLMTVNMDESVGCDYPTTINQTARMIAAKGVQKAYAVDGGQTAVIAMQGETVNPVDYRNERTMSDIIYFATALPENDR